MSDLAYKPDASPPVRSEPAQSAMVVDVRPVPRVSIQAFCESPDLIAAINAAAQDRRMARAHLKVQAGGIAAAAEFYQAAATPNLIIVESKLPRDRLEMELDRLSAVCDPGTKVIVIGHMNDVDLYRSLVQRGISEYLVAPVGLMEIIKTVSDLYVERSTAPLGRTIAFVGAKGGVGSSLVAHNVAWAISREFESDALVADLDLAFGTAGLDFNQDPSQGIAEALGATDRLDDNFLDRLLARCSDHLNLLAAPATLDRTYDFPESAFEPVIDLAQSGAPAVILDVPHAWNAWVRRTLLSADEVVITAEPDLANLRNAKNLVDLLKAARSNDHPPRLVINKNGLTKRPEIKIADFANALQIEPVAVIPFDAQLFGTATNNGQMIAESDPKNQVVETFALIARTVTGRADVKRAQRGGLAPLLARLLTGKKSA